MALKVLLAIPDTQYATSCKEVIKKTGLLVETAENGKDAQLIISQNKIYAAVIDAAIQNFSIQQVLKFIKSNPNITRTIVYGKEESLKELELDAEALRKMGVTEFYNKQLPADELCAILEGGQSIQDIMGNLPKREGVSEEVEVEGNDEKFTAIPIADFYASKNVLFDVYIRLGTGRYLKILHLGDTFSKERLDTYKEKKGVTHLYIATRDRQKFIQWNNFVLERTIESKAVSADTKMRMLRNVSDKYMEELFTEGVKPQLLEQGKTICNNTFKLIEKEKSLYKALRAYQDLDPTAFSHFHLISIFCSMVVKQFEWQSQSTIETLSMAAMLHDVGKMSLPKEIIQMKQSQMNEAQLEYFKKHPQASVEMLESTRLFSGPIKQVILQHHEAADGSGFPFGLKDSNLSALSKILFFVNEFVDIITEKKITPVQGVVQILNDKENFKRYNGTVVECFTKIFVDPDKIHKGHALPSNSTIVPTKKAE